MCDCARTTAAQTRSKGQDCLGSHWSGAAGRHHLSLTDNLDLTVPH